MIRSRFRRRPGGIAPAAPAADRKSRRGTGRSANPILRAGAALAALFAGKSTAQAQFNVEEKGIADFADALIGGQTTSVDVVNQYLARIQKFDRPGGGKPMPINSVAQLNPNALADAAAADALVRGGATFDQYPLLGVPVLIKDSYAVKGLTTTNGVSVLNGVGTPGSTNFVAPYDAFSVQQLKKAGAVILGKASQSTMAYSYNGIDNAHGVVLNPYQPRRQPGGSSSGSGASIASNFAMMAMGGETGGSIRVPANHNALVGLKTSLGLIDPGGTFPLTPARDVVGPLAKSVTDIAYSMNALVGPSTGNLFNGTPFYPTAAPGTQRPADYRAFLDDNVLQGKVIAVPKYMANRGAVAYEGNVHPLVLESFNRSLDTLRAQGATVIYVDEPAADTYYNSIGRPTARGGATTVGFPYDYPTTTPGGTTPSNLWSSYSAAFYYNEVISSFNDPTVKNISDFAAALRAGVDAGAGDPRSPLGTKRADGTYTGAAGNITTLAGFFEQGLAAGFGDANGDGAPDNPEAIKALQAFVDLRKQQFEGFMQNPNLADDPTTADVDESTVGSIYAFAAPTFADVVPLQTAILAADDRTDPFAIAGGGFGSLLGRLEGNLLGSPSISVPMGYLPDGTPMGIQFFDEFLGEGKLLGVAYDYEQATMFRRAPDLSFVPEPASLAVVGFVGIALVRRRRSA